MYSALSYRIQPRAGCRLRSTVRYMISVTLDMDNALCLLTFTYSGDQCQCLVYKQLVYKLFTYVYLHCDPDDSSGCVRCIGKMIVNGNMLHVLIFTFLRYVFAT